MEFKRFIFSSLLMGLVFSASASAQNIITFTGTLENTTCEAQIAGTGSGSATIDMGMIHAARLKQEGAYYDYGAKPIQINLTGCPTSLTPYAHFYAIGTAYDAAYKVAKNTLPEGQQTAQGIAIAIYVTGNTRIALPATPAANPVRAPRDPQVKVDANGNAILRYRAAYFRTGEMSPGAFSTQVGYAIHYD